MNDGRKFRIEKLRRNLSLIERKIVRQMIPIGEIYLQEPAEPRYDCPPDTGKWENIAVGDRWGGKNQWSYFRSDPAVPASWQDGAIELRLRHEPRYHGFASRPPGDYAGPEGLVFIDGERLGAIDGGHHRIRYHFEPGKSYDIRAVFFAARVECRHELAEFSLAWIDSATEKLFHDLRVTLDIVEQLSESSPIREILTAAVEKTVSVLDKRGISETPLCPDSHVGDGLFYPSVSAAQKVLDESLAKIPSDENTPTVVTLGHAHIDLAWLWEIKHTRHKCVRTFSTQCRLLDQYADWVINQSSPQAYKWLEQDAPDLFEKIKKHVSAGRWDADGAMWCEPDTNITGGESLVRQLLYGKRYFKDKFGIDSRVLWLPDVFGYSAAIPQLLKLAGVDSFVTSKISWNEYNRFPHDTFRWRGLDGTEVPVHFITTPVKGYWFFNYNAMLTAAEVKGTWSIYRQKYLQLEPLITFGYGDGGGGPTELMIETSKRLARIPAGSEMPRIKHEKVSGLMERILAKADQLPVWDGELYLEYHRGTYTTQAWLKRANRKNEIRLHNVEWLASLASAHGYQMDKAALDSMWEDLLLCQFHDILPGSSVGGVYEDEVKPMQERIAEKADTMIAKAATTLCKQINTSDYQQPVALFNTLSWDRTDPIQLPDGTWRDDVTIPAGGWTVIEGAVQTSEKNVTLSASKDGRELENQFWQLRLDEQGRIVELYDKLNERQVLSESSAANEWQVFEDRPLDNDAWNIDFYYREHPLPGPQCVCIKVVEKNAVRLAVQLDWQMPPASNELQSTISQKLVLYANNPRIDFETSIDWHEHHQLLKVAFPVDVRSTEATYNIQFGHITRPTHWNTSWDVARFEVCAHQFVDLSEHNYGVSLLNDCKYGHDVHEGAIYLTCIKSPQSPDPAADQGHHQFTYSLLPHAGTFQEAGVIWEAAQLNVSPVIVTELPPSSGKLPSQWSLLKCNSPAIILDTVKLAEDGDGTILRLYESYGSHAKAKLSLPWQPDSVSVVNLLEEPCTNNAIMQCNGKDISLELEPFQIVTLRLK